MINDRDIPRKYDGWTLTELERECADAGVPIPEQGEMEDPDFEEELRYLLRR